MKKAELDAAIALLERYKVISEFALNDDSIPDSERDTYENEVVTYTTALAALCDVRKRAGGCEWCDGIGKTLLDGDVDEGWLQVFINTGYLTLIDSNYPGLSTSREINYCPMCSRTLGDTEHVGNPDRKVWSNDQHN
ncbi:MAG: hypothetical protein ACOX7B_03390 [Christensenellales bacterium]|jgi:hypothetical protein